MKTLQKSGHLILGLLILLILSVGLQTSYADEQLENQVRKIAHQLRCPTCQAMSVKESEAGIAVNMKNKIRTMLEEGRSEAEILDFFVERYGEWILRSPQKKGFNLLLWVLPGVLIIFSALMVYLYLRKQSVAPDSNQKLSPLSEDEQAMIEKELRSRLDDE